MKIGIDLDDVLSETFTAISSFYGKKVGKEFKIENHKTYNLHETWNTTIQEVEKVHYEFNDLGHFENIPRVEGAAESIKLLSRKYELFIITARPPALKKSTLIWLSKFFNIQESHIIFAEDVFNVAKGNKKAQICNDLGIALMIEDAAHHAMDCASTGLKVILFNKPWNQEAHHKNIVRVNSWKEALEEIENLLPKDKF